MCFSFPQDIFPKYPGEQRHHVGAIPPFDKKDLTSTGRLPTSSNSFGCNYSSGSLCKTCAGNSATEICSSYASFGEGKGAQGRFA